MLHLVPLRQLSLLTGTDVSALPRPELLARIRQLFGFLGELGELGEIELRDDSAAIHRRETAKHPAAVYFLLDALQRYARLSTEDIRKITCEVAMLGREGLDYASPDEKYELRTLPDRNFSGLHLMCLMFAGFKRVAPETDAVGLDLEEPLLTALELFDSNGKTEPDRE